MRDKKIKNKEYGIPESGVNNTIHFILKLSNGHFMTAPLIMPVYNEIIDLSYGMYSLYQ